MSTYEETRDSTRAQWNEFSGGWKKWDQQVMEGFRDQGEALLDTLPTSADGILDVATGTGEPGLTAAERRPRASVTGVDLSEGMLTVAREHASERGLDNFETHEADAGDLPFEADAFDAILCRLGVMLFPDPARALREFRRVLRPGGRVAMTVWGPPDRNAWLAQPGSLVMEMLDLPRPAPDAPGVFRFAPPGSLASTLEACGFEDVREREVTGVMRHERARENFDMLMDCAAPIVSALRQAPEETQREVRAALLEAIEADADPDGGLSLSWSAWLVTGTTPT